MDKEIFAGAWSALRARPQVWLFVSAASVPYVLGLLIGTLPAVSIPGFFLTFMLVYLAWCMAAYAYGAEEEFGTRAMLAEGREAMAYQWTKFLNLSIMVAAIIFVLMNFLLPMILIAVISMLKPSGGIITGILFQFAGYVLLALPLTLFALTPQLAILRHDFEEETDTPTGVLRMSYLLIKERYIQALPLYVLPELAALASLLLTSLLVYSAQDLFLDYGILYVPVLLVLALIEGAKTAFVAAAFNLFLDRVEEEEKKKKKKKPAKQPSKQPSKQPEKQPARELPGKKNAATKKPGPSPHKKKK